MSIEIRITGLSADEALTELKTFSAGLLGGVALTRGVQEAVPLDVPGHLADLEKYYARQEGETEEQHGERVKRKRRTKAEMEAARAAEANEAHAEPVVGVDAGVGDIEVRITPVAEEGRLPGEEDPFPPSETPRAVISSDDKAKVVISHGPGDGFIASETEVHHIMYPPMEPVVLFTTVDFATAYAAYKGANPDKDEGAFLRAELQKLVDKIGMDAAREFMVANKYGAVSKIKPEERTAFLTAVYGKMAE